jgi:hypothetical protein
MAISIGELSTGEIEIRNIDEDGDTTDSIIMDLEEAEFLLSRLFTITARGRVARDGFRDAVTLPSVQTPAEAVVAPLGALPVGG